MSAEKGSYEVGYGKPPKEHQFKKGQSGHAAGRTKGTRNFKTELLEEFGELIELREGDRKRRVSKQRALIKSLMARGLTGNEHAAVKLVEIYLKVVGLTDEATEAGTPLTAEERAVLSTLEARILRQAGVAQSPERKTADDEGGAS